MAETGSLIRTIEAFSGSQGRGLVQYIPDKPTAAERALAQSEALDPESAGETFEPLARPGFWRGFAPERWRNRAGAL